MVFVCALKEAHCTLLRFVRCCVTSVHLLAAPQAAESCSTKIAPGPPRIDTQMYKELLKRLLLNAGCKKRQPSCHHASHQPLVQ